MRPSIKGPTKLQKSSVVLSDRRRTRFTLCCWPEVNTSAEVRVLREFIGPSFLTRDLWACTAQSRRADAHKESGMEQESLHSRCTGAAGTPVKSGYCCSWKGAHVQPPPGSFTPASLGLAQQGLQLGIGLVRRRI